MTLWGQVIIFTQQNEDISYKGTDTWPTLTAGHHVIIKLKAEGCSLKAGDENESAAQSNGESIKANANC